ncbi:MAG: NUDIX domain-containing protein, partial [Chloroflexaceae bacterium]|nr:NUDIX domain-containing protein [Chloroflexaceae bacterium]
MTQPYAHCHFCGAPYQNLAWPRSCAVCGRTAYRNVLPVAVVVQPVDAGLLTVRRAISPGFGELALPGGYINHGETWEAAATR